MRKSPSAAEEILWLKRRKEIYERLHPQSKKGAAQALKTNMKLGRVATAKVSASFVSDTATKTGQSVRTVFRGLSVARNLSEQQLEMLKGTEAAKSFSELRKISRLPDRTRADVVSILAQKKTKSVHQARALLIQSSPMKPNVMVDGQVIHGDSLESLRRLPPSSVDLVFTSPPYYQKDIDFEIEGDIGSIKALPRFIDALAEISKECKRVLRPTGTLVINIADTWKQGASLGVPQTLYGAIPLATGLTPVNDVIWVKTSGLPQPDLLRFACTHEHFLVFVNECGKQKFLPPVIQGKTLPIDADIHEATCIEKIRASQLSAHVKECAVREIRTAANRLRFGEIVSFDLRIAGVHRPLRQKDSGEATNMKKKGYAVAVKTGFGIQGDVVYCSASTPNGTDHPAPMPLSLAEFFVKAFTEPGDTVLDPFFGSGTTGLACSIHGRKWIGIEKNARYIEAAKSRIAAWKPNLSKDAA